MSKDKIEKWDEINGNVSHEERLEAFFESSNDCYAILQLRHIDETRYERFSSRAELERMGVEPQIDHYEVVYIAPLVPYIDQNIMLENIFEKFNLYHPEDFRGHSLSVSDIVALKQNDVISCHYVDSIGFKELPHFMKPENYLKNAEITMEDDYGMIDGVINNGKSKEIEDKSSVIEKLKNTTPNNSHKNPSRISQERELE